MSVHQAFRRATVPPQTAQKSTPYIIPAPTRGLVMSENLTFMQPGGAMICDNWVPTMRGVKLRGGFTKWCDVHSLDTVVPPIGDASRKPIVSGFEYSSGNGTTERMYAANATTLFDVTLSGFPTVVKTGQTSGNYAATQFANAGFDWLIAVNDGGDPVLRFNGTTWTTLATTTPAVWAVSTAYAVDARALDTSDGTHWKCLVAHTSGTGTFAADRAATPANWTRDVAADGSNFITGPAGSAVENGQHLVYVWKYRSRLFFIERNSMNAWYLGINSVGGVLSMIPLAGSTTRGGKLIFGATWSVDAGDGMDDKCVFFTTEGEAIIFTGSNPADAANWRQEGRFQMSPPLGMNAHMPIGGDLLVATTDGIIPMSQAITKTAEQLELAALTRNIKPLWRTEVADKNNLPWTMKHWDEYGGVFVTTPGGAPGNRYCLVVNAQTTAWCRFVGYDAMCWMTLRNVLFFGTQDGTVMQADRGGTDDGKMYIATLVGGWEMFQTPPATVVWRQARASFTSASGENFQPQLAACVDYTVTLPTSTPPVIPEPPPQDVWDEGLWGPPGSGSPPTVVPPPEDIEAYAQWDQPSTLIDPPVRNTGWVSIGETGFSHAPIVQVAVSQRGRPRVELISISCMYERVGTNV